MPPPSSTKRTACCYTKYFSHLELLCLPYHEVLRLRNELKEYTKQYSDILVVELENRDAYIREKELKNAFISSFLSVQEKLRETTAAQTKKKFSLQSNNSPNSQVCICFFSHPYSFLPTFCLSFLIIIT